MNHIPIRQTVEENGQMPPSTSMMESFSVEQTVNVVEVEKIPLPPSMTEIPSHLSMIVEREKTYSKENGYTTAVFNETTTVFEKNHWRARVHYPLINYPLAEDWIAKVHRINKKNFGPDGEVVEEKFDLKKEVNHENDCVKNKLAEMKNEPIPEDELEPECISIQNKSKKGSQYNDVAGSTSSNELIAKDELESERISIQNKAKKKYYIYLPNSYVSQMQSSQYEFVSGSTSSNEEPEETLGDGGEQENLNETVSDFWPLFSKKKSSNF